MTAIASKETQLVSAYKTAEVAGQDFALKALICGQMICEMRDEIRSLSHSGTSYLKGRNQHSGDDGFYARLEALGIPKSNAYRYCTAAERVARAQLGLSLDAPFRPVIELESGELMPLSRALTAPEKSLSSMALKFRQDVFDFMADHTLGEAARAVFAGDDDPKRITLAAGGKTKGGKGSGDRKAFDVFAKTKLKHLTTFMGQKLTVNQKAQIVAAFDNALEQWPRWIVEGIAEKCRTELKLAESDRAARSTFEKA